MGRLRNFEIGAFRRLRRDPPEGKIHRIAFWLLLAYLPFLMLQALPGAVGSFFHAIADLIFVLLISFAIVLFWRWLMRRVLWKVRSRLVVTYLLMGLTPVVLFATLALVLLYVFSGQFAIFAANDVIDLEQAHIASENRAFAITAAHTLAANPKAAAVTLPSFDDTDPNRPRTGIAFAAFEDGRPLRLIPDSFNTGAIRQPPFWVQGRFSGLVEDRGGLFLRAVDTETVGKATVTTITSLPLQKENVEQIARGLGAVTIIPDLMLNDENTPGPKPRTTVTFSRQSFNQPLGVKVNGRNINQLEQANNNIHPIEGGSIPPSMHFYDVLVTFVAPLDTRDWQTGKPLSTFTRVDSRPSALYKRLFIASLNTAPIWRDVFIGLAIFFGFLELFAFFLAVRLNLTITRSVRDLYQATQAIDQGDLTHRISVTRNDQLAALSRSFNNMTTSLARLLEEQREKQRLQNELSIAQEVQANLFPRSSVSLPMLELHGACYPARTVSGDYYDFLLSGRAGLGIAIGDISGKGISAALLMATLHSAVRAFRFAGEELILEGTAATSKSSTRLSGQEEIEYGELFEEPSRMLALLNHHLYCSTQPEKYATLFLAHYDGATRRLVYSNGGQLPPFLLRTNDSITRLDRGGTVVGLIDNMTYEQGTEFLSSGDILIAYSDGVTEPENEFGEFGEGRLIEVVRRHRHLSLEAISEQVMQSLRSWIGGQEQPDDITLVLARQL
ncbi:MAG TPA: SpoIIE family protein phosphatase [Acidobacteriaceae bacterium]|nr:SpoIIE family protein phosphatase [Acidobacteriaceae bacterium]